MSIVDFLNIPGVSNPQLSPDGTKLIYILSKSNWKANKQISHIWLVRSDGDDAHQITFGPGGVSSPSWSPDGKWISFITKRNDDQENQIYIMRSDGGEGRRLTNHKTAVSSYQWFPDSETIYFLANDTLSKEEETAKELKDDVYSLDENYKQRHLWTVNLKNSEELRMTQGDYSILSYKIAKDGHGIVVHRGPNPLIDHYKESEIWIMDIDGSNPRQLTENRIEENGARLSPDGKQVIFTAFANEHFDFYYNDKIFLMPADGKDKAMVPMKDFPYEVLSAEWSADGRSIYFIANMGSQTQLWQYELSSEKLSQITAGKHSVGQWHYHRELNQHLMAISTIENPGDIFLFQNGQLQQITHHYDYLKNEFYLPEQEVISWRGEDGVTIEGIIYYPHDHDPGKSYPLVVQTHGGPQSSDKLGLSRSISRYDPVLTSHGYIVIQPNYRGSTGYGDDFLRDMVGGYFRQSHLDVMAGVDYLIDQGIADPDRLVKMGWSAGGHMTNKIITFTNRFKAASSGAGAINWIGMYAQSDVRTYRTPWFGGSPWQKDAPIDVYWDNSPLKDISKVTTPTLVMVGRNDLRVPYSQSLELHRALKSLGVPTHLYVAPREPHGWRELRHRLYKINVELEWFAKYALNKEYQWEKVEE
jgi:dipeptidyl aminopeptidase/acylaminoacyl peptidase